MKIKKLLLLCILPALSFLKNECRAQINCDSVFSKEYIGAGHIQSFVTKQLRNNELLVAGRASSSPAGGFQLMAAKFSASGAIRWSNLLGGNDLDTIKGIIELSDNSLLLYGIAGSFGYANGKVLLIRLGADGILLWGRQLGYSSASKDIIKDIIQSADGDLICTFNTNDSSSLSDPVVFKLGLDGTVRWARKFDNSGDDSFTSLAEWNNILYAGGFTTTSRKQSALVTINPADGGLMTSQSPAYYDITYMQEITDVEVFNNRISYGLWSKKAAGTSTLVKLILYQASLTGSQLSQRVVSFNEDHNPVSKSIKRGRGTGFFVKHLSANSPTIVKLSPYFNIEWSTLQAQMSPVFNIKGNSFDITNFNGAVSASYYRSFSTNNLDRIVISKTSAAGTTGVCTQAGGTFFMDTVVLQSGSLSWANAAITAITLNQEVTLATVTLPLTTSPVCDTVFCTDTTPLPPYCNQTSLVEYSGYGSSNFRDLLNLNDGGKVLVGEFFNQGFITRTGNNDDIIWSRTFDEVARQTVFMRVLKSGPDNFIAFANNYYVIDHYAYRNVKMIKLDVNGNILLSKEITSGATGNNFEMADVCSTPDGGFVIILNWGWGIGYLYSYVMRFDSALNIVWQKEIKHFVATPVYRSVSCDGNAIYIGHDSYDSYNQNKIGIQKLDYATGNDVWSKGYTMNVSMLRFSKIIAIHDTVYSFINRHNQINFNNYDFRIAMMKVTAAGNFMMAKTLNTDNLEWPTDTPTGYIDFSSPTVTITSDSNFVMSHRAKNPSSSVLNITKFDKEGNGTWSKNYMQLNNANVYHVKSHDSSILITGNLVRPRSGNPRFKNGFILKANSGGNILSTATGICMPTNSPFSSVPTAVTEVPSNIDSVVNISFLSVIPSGNIAPVQIDYDAALYCNQVAYCSTVRLIGDSSACSLNDTLRFFPVDNNCGALIRITYDTSFFSYFSHTSDTIKLVPRFAGVSVIQAHIESPCLDTIQAIQVSVLLSATSVNIGADT
ncbi:MAG TPA: hypothetical protein VFV31_08430, partial [Chitinophagaceae bacterium]|nr:hypothetical protein [Chitinophagaceae bacterium]